MTYKINKMAEIVTALEKITSDEVRQGSKTLPNKITIKTPSLSLFIARSNSGKSHLMKSILYTLAREDRFSWVLVFSTTKFNNEWVSIVGDKNVTDQFDTVYLQDLLAKQGELILKGKAKPGLIILDDMVGTASWNADVITKIATTARHYNISCWISSQWYFKLSTVLRSNVNYMYVLNSVSEKLARSIFEEFPCDRFRKWRDLQDYANKATIDFGCMMIDNSSQNPVIHTIRAPAKLKKFQLIPRVVSSARKTATKKIKK